MAETQWLSLFFPLRCSLSEILSNFFREDGKSCGSGAVQAHLCQAGANGYAAALSENQLSPVLIS